MMFRVEIINWEKHNGRKTVKKSSWFRFYNKAPQNPKIFNMSDKEYRIWDWMLCLASQAGGFSFVADPTQIGMNTKAAEDVVVRALILYASLGLIRVIEKIDDKVTPDDVERFLADPISFTSKRNADDARKNAEDRARDSKDHESSADVTRALREGDENQMRDTSNEAKLLELKKTRNAEAAIGEERRGEERRGDKRIYPPTPHVMDTTAALVGNVSQAFTIETRKTARQQTREAKEVAVELKDRILSTLYQGSRSADPVEDLGPSAAQFVLHKFGSYRALSSVFRSALDRGSVPAFEGQLRDSIAVYLKKKENPPTGQGQGAQADNRLC